jgi:hypothetical protein
MPSLTTAPSLVASPDIPVDYSALPILAGDVISLLNEFLALLMRDIQQRHLPAARIEVRGTNDPEDDSTQVLVRLWAYGLSHQELRQYRGEFGHRVDDWMQALTEDRKSRFAENISFQARRAADA